MGEGKCRDKYVTFAITDKNERYYIGGQFNVQENVEGFVSIGNCCYD